MGEARQGLAHSQGRVNAASARESEHPLKTVHLIGLTQAALRSAPGQYLEDTCSVLYPPAFFVFGNECVPLCSLNFHQPDQVAHRNLPSDPFEFSESVCICSVFVERELCFLFLCKTGHGWLGHARLPSCNSMQGWIVNTTTRFLGRVKEEKSPGSHSWAAQREPLGSVLRPLPACCVTWGQCPVLSEPQVPHVRNKGNKAISGFHDGCGGTMN